jgi:hypothetical protein
VLSRFQELLDGETRDPLSEEESRDAIAEAKRRIGQLIPPGYRDAKKQEPCGDYFIWKQTLLEVARREIRYFVFVTSDNKEDWYQIIKGGPISALRVAM